MIRHYRIFGALACAALVSGCSKLSPEAKEITGVYFINEVSQTEPLMELRPDATCLIRAMKPGVLTYSVEGTWNVVTDSLVLNLDPSTLIYEGDSSFIGPIPTEVKQRVIGHSDFSLELQNDGIEYLYQRRPL